MKYWLAPLGLLLSTSVLADGFYMGSSVGMSSVNTEESVVSYKTDHGKSAPIGSLYGGYRFDLDQYFVAIESDVTFGDVKIESRTETDTSKFTRKEVYSLSFLGGIPLSDKADIYGRLGYAQGSFKMEAGDLDTGTTNSVDKKEKGWVIGLGSQFQLNDNFSIRLDYRYTQYSDIKLTDAANTEFKYKNTDQQYTVGVTYSF